MPLTLTVLRCPPNVAPEVRQVTGGEFSIGRGSENDWVLPDPIKHLSKRHCVIAFRSGAWQVAGTSTNGTFVNRDQTRLESRGPHTLADGDRLILGVYEIEVRMAEEARLAWGSTGTPDSFGNPLDEDPFASNPNQRPQRPSAAPGSDLPPYSASLPADFDGLSPHSEDVFPGPTQADHSSAISDAINLPPVKSVLPDDWDLDDFAPSPEPRRDARPPSRRAGTGVPVTTGADPVNEPPMPVPASERGPASGDLLAAFFRGAGLDLGAPADAAKTMEQLGAAFRAVVSGIRDALIARSEVKREFRIEATLIRSRGNNLLKFSENDDDALAGLLGVGRRTDMGAAEAIADALTDLRLHELATMAAMQTAVRALVARLGPDQIRDAKDQTGGLALLSSRKARAWDAYEALHAQVLHGLSDDFDSVFGKQFAVAYERAMEEFLVREKHRGNGRR